VGQLLQQNGAFGLIRREKSQSLFKSLLTKKKRKETTRFDAFNVLKK
jgi:hypothetical protein